MLRNAGLSALCLMLGGFLSLVALVARLNLCLFWFHPVAWWLERKLAMSALR